MRKTKDITIDTPGRDYGKVFRLTEKSAIEADKWGIRALLAITKSGVSIPDEMMKMGIVGILAVGVHRLAGVSYEDLGPLLDEMMSCIQFIPNKDNPDIIRKLFPDDIEEVSTILTLRKEVFGLHTDFSMPAAAPGSQTGASAGENS